MNIAEEIFDKRTDIVPVIGENCFFYYHDDGTKIPLQEFLIDRMVEMQKVSLDAGTIRQMKEKGFYGLSLCRQRCGFNNDEQYIKCYKSIVREFGMKIHMDDKVREFLMAYRFPLVITTCCFDFMEKDMPGYASKMYVAANGADNRDEIDARSHVVYHIFGKCNGASIWAWDEEALLYILHCHHNADFATSGLRRYMFPEQNPSASVKSLLILYNNLPDWLFRFILFPLAYNGKWSDGFYMNTKGGEGDSLTNFIEKVICYSVPEEELDSVLMEATKKAAVLVQERGSGSEKREEHHMSFDVFISHAVEDNGVAEKIKSCLEKCGLKVWLDESGGIEDGSYVEKIRYGIENSAYFMPLLTRAYIGKLKNGVCPFSGAKDEVLKDDGKMSYVQKEVLTADIQRRIFFAENPGRKAYLLPVMFRNTGIDIDTLKVCYGMLGQLPKELFAEQTVFYYDSMFGGKDWSRYKTVEC